MKNNGPNKEPCRVPKVTVSQSEASPFTTKCCLQCGLGVNFQSAKQIINEVSVLVIAF